MLDLAKADDKALLEAMLAKADVFIQNLKPGAVGEARLPHRAAAPRLSAADLLLDLRLRRERPVRRAQGLRPADPGRSRARLGHRRPGSPARVGVSVVDIAAGMNAYEAILEALIVRGRTGEGAAISVSMFDAMADWMTVPLLQHEGGEPPKRIGLAHTSISPYGAFKTRDGADILISIQNDREWRVLAEKVLGDKALAADPNFATNVERVKRRAETDGRVAAAFASLDVEPLVEKLAAADIAFGRINDLNLSGRHPHLRRITVDRPSGPVHIPAPTAIHDGAMRQYGAVPALGEHTEKVRREFAAK